MVPDDLSQTARTALACLDLTDLADDSNEASVNALCQKAIGAAYGLGPVAAVCVWPRWVALARTQLPAQIAVAAVVNFPSGNEPVAAVLQQVDELSRSGAQEVDLVFPYRRLLAGTPADLAHCTQVLQQVRQASQGLVLKVILESGELPATLLPQACDMALRAGADFLKTSTGKTPHGASLEACRTMLQAIHHHPNRDRLGLKPSGGLRTVADVKPYIELVAEILGPQAVVPARFRIGASGLWNDIARVLGADTSASAPVAPPSY
ncbi:MAG: deoxyribose-phosphate aldolase [Pseudomonadota bacterium]